MFEVTKKKKKYGHRLSDITNDLHIIHKYTQILYTNTHRYSK